MHPLSAPRPCKAKQKSRLRSTGQQAWHSRPRHRHHHRQQEHVAQRCSANAARCHRRAGTSAASSTRKPAASRLTGKQRELLAVRARPHRLLFRPYRCPKGLRNFLARHLRALQSLLPARRASRSWWARTARLARDSLGLKNLPGRICRRKGTRLTVRPHSGLLDRSCGSDRQSGTGGH